jgi:hypothetical protein
MEFRIFLIRRWSTAEDTRSGKDPIEQFRCPCCREDKVPSGAWYAHPPRKEGSPVLICSKCARLTHWHARKGHPFVRKGKSTAA